MDDLGRDGVDNHRLLWLLLGVVEGRLWRLFRRRMWRRLPDLVGLFADFQRRRSGALELDLFLLLLWRISRVRPVHFCWRFVWIVEREGKAFGDDGKGEGKLGNLGVADEYSMLYELGTNYCLLFIVY